VWFDGDSTSIGLGTYSVRMSIVVFYIIRRVLSMGICDIFLHEIVGYLPIATTRRRKMRGGESRMASIRVGSNRISKARGYPMLYVYSVREDRRVGWCKS
jgi:hypothetical protein